jgi:cytochrome b561
MAGRMLIFALMTVRFIVRMQTSRPAGSTTGYPQLDRIASMTHYGFCVLVLLMVGTGFATAILAQLDKIVFQGSGDPCRRASRYIRASSHTAILRLFWPGFIMVHVLATLYHHFATKDGLIRRMWFGRRES